MALRSKSWKQLAILSAGGFGGANGRITDTEYIIYEQPQPKKLDMLPSDVVSPDTENRIW